MDKPDRPRRYRAGRTINTVAWDEGEDKPLPILKARQIVGIKTRTTVNLSLKFLGWFGSDYLNWEQIKHLLGMSLWLRCNLGVHNRIQYVALKKEGLVESALLEFGIDLNKKFEEVKNAYNQQQKQQVSSHWNQAS